MKYFCRCFAILILLLSARESNGEILRQSNGTPVRYAGNFSAKVINLPAAVIRTRQTRAVWVATVENIDFGPFVNAAQFRNEAAAMMRQIKRANFNTVFFQVRSNCDAWYPSALNPYSRYLTGKEGRGIAGIDPLKILIDEAHRNQLEFHAWFNPYRVTGGTPLSKNAYLKTLAPNNFARQNPGAVLCVPIGKNKNSLLLDPGNPAVRKHIVQSIMEVVSRYNIDAVHFDDYFYLYSDIRNADAASFARYNYAGKSLANWRRDNVTTVIMAVHHNLKSFNRKYNRKVAFGISPFGIWANKRTTPAGSLTGGKECYTTLYADVRRWIKAGLIDYVVPQLYWGFNHSTAAYACLADWWANQVRGTRVRLFTGHAIYRLGSSQEFPVNEIFNQLRYNQTRNEITGFALFSYRRFFKPENNNMKRGVNLIKSMMRLPAQRVKYNISR